MTDVLAAPRGPVAVLGSGRLHAAIRSALARTGRPVATAAHDGVTALVLACDADDTRGYGEARRRAAELRVPWLPVRVEGGCVLVGPAVRPGTPGCPTCAERRRAANRPDAPGRDELRRRYGHELASRPSRLVTPVLAAAVGVLVAGEVDRLRHDPASARSAGALLRLAVPTATVRRHPVLADPLCPDCGSRPDDHPEASRPLPVSARKPHPAVFRVGDIAPRAAELERMFVDAETGFVQGVAFDTRGGTPMAVARLAPARTVDESHHGYGRSDDFAAARATAIVEALERVAGIHPRGRRTVVRAPYADVAGHALDPRTLGLYPDDRYDLPGFWFTRFHPEKETSWVWGYSFRRDAPVLVPECFVYYGPRPEGDRGFAYECSNGCAIGGTPVEAILHGLLEVAERDAFLTAWYARLPIPRVDLGSAADRRIPLAAERIRHRYGYEVAAFVATLEQGLPVFWVIAVDRTGGPGRPKAVCASGAHLSPERALRRAIHDLGPALEGQLERYDEAAAARLLADSDRVRRLEDHPMLYCHPDAFERLAFLPFDGPARTLAEITAEFAWPAHDDLGADLAELVGRYLASGLDVITVDTTSPEARAVGLASAKVLVPGAMPMTFGHRHRRTHGLPRLLSLPRLLGYRDADLRPDELNPFPHPFP